MFLNDGETFLRLCKDFLSCQESFLLRPDNYRSPFDTFSEAEIIFFVSETIICITENIVGDTPTTFCVPRKRFKDICFGSTKYSGWPKPRQDMVKKDIIKKQAHRGGTGMPIKLDGMSEVTRNMEQLKRALDGAFTGLSFDPLKPQEMERAIREIEMKVDMKFAPYISSPGVREIVSDLKEEYRKAIQQKAAEAQKPQNP
jgi:hypothetical protein